MKRLWRALFWLILFCFSVFLVYECLPVTFQLAIKKKIFYADDNENFYIEEGKKLVYQAYPYVKKQDKNLQVSLSHTADNEWLLQLWDSKTEIGGGYSVIFNDKLEVQSIEAED